MNLSSQTLRETFKNKIEGFILALKTTKSPEPPEKIIEKIQKMSEEFEHMIQSKIALLEADFAEHPLTGEYLRTVTEGFDDLDRLLRTHKTLVDAVQIGNLEGMLDQIKGYYLYFLIPFINIVSKLENDLISVATLQLEKTNTTDKHQSEIKK